MDYIMGEGEVRDRVIEMRIGERERNKRIDSDHHPVKVCIKGKVNREGRIKEEGKGWRVIWDVETSGIRWSGGGKRQRCED